MVTTIGFGVLKPYKTLILAQVKVGDPERIVVEDVIADLKSVLDVEGNPDLEVVTEGPAAFLEVPRPGSTENDYLHVAFLHYIEKRAPSWYGGGDELQDTLNHLMVACQLNRQVAIYLSDARRRRVTRRGGRGPVSGPYALTISSRSRPVRQRQGPSSVTATMSSMRTPKRPGR